jgi:hypothetical protein
VDDGMAADPLGHAERLARPIRRVVARLPDRPERVATRGPSRSGIIQKRPTRTERLPPDLYDPALPCYVDPAFGPTVTTPYLGSQGQQG